MIHKKELVEPPFKCQVCDMSFILEEALHYHQKVEHDFKIECFECKECLRNFFCKGSYQVHIRIHLSEGGFQPKDELYLCEFCCDYANSVPDIVDHYKIL